LSPIVCHAARWRAVVGRRMLAGASELARPVPQHDQALISLHLRGRTRRELLSASPCNSHMHDFSPACWMKFRILRVISREFGRQHRHMMHESYCTHHEQHDGVLESGDSPELSRYHSHETEIVRNCHPIPDKIAVFRRIMYETTVQDE